MLSTSSKLRAFRTTVWNHYRTYGRRHLPWRATTDPYRILVSEVMLQQTQVERVIPYYHAFLKQFSTVRALSRAPLAKVLKLWQGLGYNRRAKNLHSAAKEVVKVGKFPENLESLPGVGPYTARAVRAFAYNEDVVFIETNIRTAVIHQFFPNKTKVEDKDILSILENVLPKGNSREWYGALMDYGSYLKRTGIRINKKSSHYTKQSAFKGSDREARGAILRELARGVQPSVDMLGKPRRAQVRAQLQKLIAEGMIDKKRTRYVLSG